MSPLCWLRFVLLLVMMVRGTVSFSSYLLELTIGPRLKSLETLRNQEDYKNSSSLDAVKELVNKYGYPLEAYQITTTQGYIITLHRIPYGRKRTGRKRQVVLLHPGFCGSPELFLFRGPQHDMPYLFTDSGYDFWFINNRGNTYSRNHVILNPDVDKEFWNFTLDDSGLHDLPNSVDFILEKTGQDGLILIGYSMGAGVGQIMLSRRPEYNQKIKLFINLAPSVYVMHQLMPQLRMVFNLIPVLAENIMNNYNIYELFPRTKTREEILTAFCLNGSRTQRLCVMIAFLAMGFDYEQFNTDNFPNIFKYFPDGTSIQSILHLQQMYTTGEFKPYDYGNETNQILYNSTKPPEYDLTKNVAPMAIYYGDGDYIVAKEDCVFLAEKLPNVVGLFRVPFRNFNHLDFMWGINAKELVYDHMNKLINKYRQY
ncbi:lipase 3-like [Onthophagus taurus]|uniref:lipase 3-like n=1 Tax=Onthophagus taurus TaxID=166361 RepID=UPI0039BE0B1B